VEPACSNSPCDFRFPLPLFAHFPLAFSPSSTRQRITGGRAVTGGASLGSPNNTGSPTAPRSRRLRMKTDLGWSTNGARRLRGSCLPQRPILARSPGSARNSRAAIFLTCPSKKNGLNGRSPMTPRSLRHTRREPRGAPHEAPASIGPKAQPATDGRALEAAQAVTANRARGFGPALTPPIKVSSPPLHPGGFFFCPCRARRSAGSPSPAASFEVRPIPSAGKIERPTAVRTVSERPGG
jgi:hypothetical protein